MKINLSKLSSSANSSALEPRDIFMSLPSPERYEYPRDVQSEVWRNWFLNRDKKNTIIKMNTGSGKTVVGLLVLQSCLNEGKGPAVYVVPDSYLVNQVLDEAKKLGIRTTTDEDDYLYQSQKAILVINIHKLVNGKSVFGMRQWGNINIGSVIIDDAHACFNTLKTQFMIRIKDNDLYAQIIEVLRASLKQYSDQQYHFTVECRDPQKYMLVPFYIWQKNVRTISDILEKYSENDELKFCYPLLRDCLELCSCVITGGEIEIAPRHLPISRIASFEKAERRIFMSATLADDSVFATALGLSTEDVCNIVTPEKANDIGDRLMLFPQVLNRSIDDKQLKEKLVEMAKTYNVVVIVPSEYRSVFWRDSAQRIVSTENINQCVAELKKNHVGLCVFINKYDGIDLPDEACRILVIDGLPSMLTYHDQYVAKVDPNSEQLLQEKIQKLEQGLGRGVRSNSDYCVTILMGRTLSDAILNEQGYRYFSNATRVQYDLSRRLWDQLLDEGNVPSIDDILSLCDYSLKRDMEWITLSKETLMHVKYDKEPRISDIAFAARRAFDYSCNGDYDSAITEIENAKNRNQTTLRMEEIGYLQLLLAEYTNHSNEEKAQELVLSAQKNGCKLVRPWTGIQHAKLFEKRLPQAASLREYITESGLTLNKYIIRMHAICEELIFSAGSSSRFEQAIMDLAMMLGYIASRPERDYGKGPDDLWALGEGQYLVIECKNETTTTTISKHDCNQLNGSNEWFKNEYHGNGFICHPIMIHNSNIFEHAASPNQAIRIMTPSKLSELNKALIRFSEELARLKDHNDTALISQLLRQYKLNGIEIVNEYTIPFKVAQRS